MSAYLWLISEMLLLLTLAAVAFFALGWRWQGQRARARLSDLEVRLDAEAKLAKLATEQREEWLKSPPVSEAVVAELKEAEARQQVLEREMLRLRDEKKEVEHTLAKMQVEARVRTVSAEANDTQTLSAETLVRDELTRIRGIGRVLSEKLGEAGVTSFHQLATLSPEQMEALDVKLGLRGRMQRDRWQEQARALHEEIYGKAKG